jgi:predicted ribosome quality control (RQC) complex YloA/Tae2 family protein
MVKNTYACTGCKKTFSRKYNAERHNKLKHAEMAVVYNKETDWISNKRKTNVNVQRDSSSSTLPPSLSPTQTSAPLSPTPFSYPTSTSISDTDNKNTISEPYHDFLKDFNLEDHNSKINENTDIEKIFKIFEKISPLIDELDTQLSTYKIHEERMKILSDSIISALSSYNPVQSLKEIIKLHRSTMGIKKASGFVAFSHNIPLDKAQSMLATIILTAPYSKKNKFDK